MKKILITGGTGYLGRNLATDLKPEGISVGIYHPGWVQTDMTGNKACDWEGIHINMFEANTHLSFSKTK